jgi:hypothetical protein
MKDRARKCRHKSESGLDSGTLKFQYSSYRKERIADDGTHNQFRLFFKFQLHKNPQETLNQSGTSIHSNSQCTHNITLGAYKAHGQMQGAYQNGELK